MKKRVLIVGEGQQTEYIYFDGLKKEDVVSRCLRVVVKKGPGISAEEVVKTAQKLVDRERIGGDYFDHVYCVIDVESPHARTGDLSRARQLAKKSNIVLILSNPSFEVWLLAHFVRSCQSFLNCDAVVNVLSQHWRSTFGRDYAKSDRDVYGTEIKSRTENAVRNARDVRETDHGGGSIEQSNSSTEVYRLVEYLLSNHA
jgi:hypothetical protein